MFFRKRARIKMLVIAILASFIFQQSVSGATNMNMDPTMSMPTMPANQIAGASESALIPSDDMDSTLSSISPELAAKQAAEHEYFMNLSQDTASTYVVTQDTSWSELVKIGAAKDGAEIRIAAGVTVTIDGQFDQKIKWINVQGTLTFATDVNTRLTVDTIFVQMEGSLLVGTQQNPVADNVTAEIVIASWNGLAIDLTWDYKELSRGIISTGKMNMYGTETTGFVTTTDSLGIGQNSLRLASIPTGWNVGDQIVLPPTVAQGAKLNSASYEIFVITAISADGTITLDHAALYDHSPDPVTGMIYVTNLTRNVVVRSLDPSIPMRGHVMSMHSTDVDIEFAGFYSLGRTLADSGLATDPALDSNGDVIPDSVANTRGRYALHIHRTGNQSNPATVNGSVVWDAPGWGFVNHSSYAEFTNNVAFHVIGSAFVTEAGDELGSFVGNLAMDLPGGTNAPNEDIAQALNAGMTGNGFWLEGLAVLVQSNTVIGARGRGFGIFPRPEKGVTSLPVDVLRAQFCKYYNMCDPMLFYGMDSIPIAQIPGYFDGNTVLGGLGFGSWFWQEGSDHNVDTQIKNFLVVGGTAIDNNYTRHITISDSGFYGLDGGGTGLNLSTRNAHYTIINSIVEGYGIGLLAPGFGNNSIIDSVFKNSSTNISISTIDTGSSRAFNLTRVQFEQWGTTKVDKNGNIRFPFVNIKMNFVVRPEIMFPWDWTAVFDPDKIYITDASGATQQLFWNQQKPDFVPFPDDANADLWEIPTAFRNKTAQQLFDEFGVAVAGMLAGGNLVIDPLILGGVLGAPAVYPPRINQGFGLSGSDADSLDRANNAGGIAVSLRYNGNYIDTNMNILADKAAATLRYVYPVTTGWNYGTETVTDPVTGQSYLVTWFHYINPRNVDDVVRDEPEISNIAVVQNGSNVTLTWDTDEMSNTAIQWGLTPGYGSIQTPKGNAPDQVTAHSLALSKLAPNTTYHFRLKSCDASGDCAYSQDMTFTTGNFIDSIGPVLGNVNQGSIDAITGDSARISWTTANEAATTQVFYGTTSSLGSASELDPALTTQHRMTLNNLQPETIYYFKVSSCDASGNCSESQIFTFATLKAVSVAPAPAPTAPAPAPVPPVDSTPVPMPMPEPEPTLPPVDNTPAPAPVPAPMPMPEPEPPAPAPPADPTPIPAPVPVPAPTDTTPPAVSEIYFLMKLNSGRLVFNVGEKNTSVNFVLQPGTAERQTITQAGNKGNNSVRLENLISGKTYNYRLTVTDTAGNKSILKGSFTTAAAQAPPVANAAAARPVAPDKSSVSSTKTKEGVVGKLIKEAGVGTEELAKEKEHAAAKIKTSSKKG